MGRLLPARRVIAENSGSGAGFVTHAFCTGGVAPVREETLDCPERVLGAVEPALAGAFGAILVTGLAMAPVPRYSAGMPIQLVELENVPRVSSRSIPSKFGVVKLEMSSVSWMATW